ncbi:MAG: FliG C-terminal domain-containing protein [Bdellovibrionales bacterium]
MSSLLRYKRSGGFNQLLSLIETFGQQKREKFLEMIEAESPVWAEALRNKMLSLERIFSWPDHVSFEIFKQLPPKSMAFALLGLKEEYKVKITSLLSQSEQRRLNDVLSESKPKPDEIASTLVKLVEVARRMLNDRELHPEKFDDGLIIPEDYEAKLEAQQASGSPPSRTEATSRPGTSTTASTAGVADSVAAGTPVTLDTAQLQRTLSAMLKENKALKEEVRTLRDKLEQIKRIA